MPPGRPRPPFWGRIGSEDVQLTLELGDAMAEGRGRIDLEERLKRPVVDDDEVANDALRAPESKDGVFGIGEAEGQ